MIIHKSIHISSIIYYEWVILCIYENAYIHVIKINEKEGMNFKELNEKFMCGFRDREEKR